MSTETLNCSASLNKAHDLESRDFSDTYEEHSLLGKTKRRGSPSTHTMKKKTRGISGPTCALICSSILLVASVTVLSRVFFQLKKFTCDFRPEDQFEPDLRFSSRVTFQPHHFYGGPPTNATNEMWRMLEPPGDGIVTMPKQYATELHPTLEDDGNPDNVIYGVSMFHQLHCLNYLRLAYFPNAIQGMAEAEVVEHRDHCLNYLRQAIMCHGDATFESLNGQGVLDGMGATHQCRDFDLLFSWAYEHRQKQKDAGYKPEKILTHSPAKQNSFDD